MRRAAILPDLLVASDLLPRSPPPPPHRDRSWAQENNIYQGFTVLNIFWAPRTVPGGRNREMEAADVVERAADHAASAGAAGVGVHPPALDEPPAAGGALHTRGQAAPWGAPASQNRRGGETDPLRKGPASRGCMEQGGGRGGAMGRPVPRRACSLAMGESVIKC
jgi:hypothetical protein